MKKVFTILITILAALQVNAQRATLQSDMALKYLVKTPKVVNNQTVLIVLLHGYGSNEADLFDLAGQLPENAIVVAARAPITLRDNSYAWYNIDGPGATGSHADETFKSVALARQLIEQAGKKYKIPASRTYVGGFSQGAIMSLDIALTHPEMIHGAIVMSGRLQDEIKPKAVSAERVNKVNIFIAHGTEDKVIPIGKGRDEKAWLDSKHIRYEYHEYPMIHTISREEMADVQKWFVKLLK
jgi:phospholipase/carboxylesterase